MDWEALYRGPPDLGYVKSVADLYRLKWKTYLK